MKIFYVILAYIIFFLAYKLSTKIKLTNEYFTEKKDWLEELFEFRQIIIVKDRRKKITFIFSTWKQYFCPYYKVNISLLV